MDGWNVLKDVVKKKIKKEIVKKKLFLFFPPQHCMSKTFILGDFAPYILHPVSVFKINAGETLTISVEKGMDGGGWLCCQTVRHTVTVVTKLELVFTPIKSHPQM